MVTSSAILTDSAPGSSAAGAVVGQVRTSASRMNERMALR